MSKNTSEKMRAETAKCPHCGAPILSEVCQYCGNYIGETETADLTAEYPVLECKEAGISFWDLAFPAIFAFSFGFAGIFSALILADLPSELGRNDQWMRVFPLPFAIIGNIAFIIPVVTIVRYLLVSLKGKEIVGTVYGYMDDTIAYNGVNGQVVKILIDTREGKRFIFYRLGHTKKTLPLNGKVRIKVYKNLFRILPEKAEYI